MQIADEGLAGLKLIMPVTRGGLTGAFAVGMEAASRALDLGHRADEPSLGALPPLPPRGELGASLSQQGVFCTRLGRGRRHARPGDAACPARLPCAPGEPGAIKGALGDQEVDQLRFVPVHAENV